MHKFALIFVLLSTTAIPVGAYAQQNAEAVEVQNIPPDSEMVYRTNLGRADDIKLLIQRGGSIYAKDNNGVGLLFLSAGRKDSEGVNLVKLYLDQGLNLNEIDPDGRNALFYAAKSGNTETVQFLLDQGIDSYATDYYSETARTVAYKAGNKDVVDVMDAFVRLKSQEVTDAYEKVNKDLESRYKKLEEEHNKTSQLALEAEKRRAALEMEAQQQKAILALETEKQKLETAKLRLENAQKGIDSTPPATGIANTPNADDSKSLEELSSETAKVQDQLKEAQQQQQKTQEEQAQELIRKQDSEKLAEEERIKTIEKQINEKINEANLTQTLKEQMHKEELENKKAEEELAAKLAAELKAGEFEQQSIEEESLSKEEQEKRKLEKEIADKAAKALQEEFYDIEVERNLQAQVAAELQWSKYEEEKVAAEKPPEKKAEDAEVLKAKKELEEKLAKQKNDLFADLIFYNCSFQYWYFCYTTKQSTELESEDLTKAIRANKDKVEVVQEQLLGEFQVDVKLIKDISDTAKRRIYKQLDDMPSKRDRHEKGVGQINDVRKRCDEVVNNWDLFSGTVQIKDPNRTKYYKEEIEVPPLPPQELEQNDRSKRLPSVVVPQRNSRQSNYPSPQSQQRKFSTPNNETYGDNKGGAVANADQKMIKEMQNKGVIKTPQSQSKSTNKKNDRNNNDVLDSMIQQNKKSKN
jgi:hypothetical protein